MTKTLTKLLIISLLVASVAACSTTDSDNVNSDGIYASYSITDNGGNGQASATFYVGGITGTVLRLSSGDSVACNGNPLTEQQNILGGYSYVGNCGTLTTGATYTVVFTRQVEDASDEVFTSSVTAPEAVTITAPSNGSTFTRGNAIPVTWNASTDNVTVSISGSGTSSSGGGSTTFLRSNSSADSGSYSIPGTDTNPDTIVGQITSGSISVSRSRQGSMDASLDGTISAIRDDQVTGLTLNP